MISIMVFNTDYGTTVGSIIPWALNGLCVWECERYPQQCVKTLAGVPRTSFNRCWVHSGVGHEKCSISCCNGELGQKKGLALMTGDGASCIYV